MNPPLLRMSPDQLALPHIAKLHAYTPGLQPTEPGWIKLNTNECPYPPSPRVAEAVQRELGADGAALRLYPNPQSAPLRAAVARLHARECPSLTAAQVCVGNGSDDILNLLIRAVCSSAGDGARSRTPVLVNGSPPPPGGLPWPEPASQGAGRRLGPICRTPLKWRDSRPAGAASSRTCSSGARGGTDHSRHD